MQEVENFITQFYKFYINNIPHSDRIFSTAGKCLDNDLKKDDMDEYKESTLKWFGQVHSFVFYF